MFAGKVVPRAESIWNARNGLGLGQLLELKIATFELYLDTGELLAEFSQHHRTMNVV